MKKTLKNLLCLSIVFIISIFPYSSLADNASNSMDVDWFNIMPKLETGDIDDINNKIDQIWKEWWEVWNKYNEAATSMKTEKQLASWIMNRDTIMNYLVFIVKFLSQLGLVVWTAFIIYAWYKYMVSVFNWWKTPNSTVKNAIIWVIIVIFSYAIMRFFTSIIWLT